MASKKTPSPQPGPGREPARASRTAAQSADANPWSPDRSSAITRIVGIGASAGGLEALEAFFTAMPADSGMAFVVVTHQLPNRTSLLPSLLARRTAMSVEEITAGTPIQPNAVYVAPSSSYLDVINTTLQPTPLLANGRPTLMIDHFLRSLAADQHERATGIILSGAGTDGIMGLRAIRHEGGLTIAQLDTESQFPSMPRSAVAADVVDRILAVADMPDLLLALTNGPYLNSRETAEFERGVTDDFFRQVCLLMRNRTRQDFTSYRATAIRGRIERRLAVRQLNDPQEYLQLLRDEPQELDQLFLDLLISVTAFFRDPEAFEILASQVLPELLARQPEHHTIRLWVPGCSTGEEAYSLAIVLRECMDRLQQYWPVQIFATDLHHQNIQQARSGHYPEGILRDVSPERLNRFFVHSEGHYNVKKELREMIVFAEQNLISDPPFTKLDLISCRNMLIYFQTSLQQRLLPLFHYALNANGILFLGSSESVGNHTDLFTAIDSRWKLFRCIQPPPQSHTLAQFTAITSDRHHRISAPPSRPQPSSDRLETLVERLLVNQFAPPSIVVNDHGDIAYIHGETGMFLQPAPGTPCHNIVQMAREGLRMQLATAIRQAGTANGEPVLRRANVETNGVTTPVNVTVRRINGPEALAGLLLVTFDLLPSASLSQTPAPAPRRSRSPYRQQVEALEQELQQTQAMLQKSLEESDTLREEFEATNEEVQSTNEELQSSNEELETSKEEMQSLNEELHTVNSELESKINHLSATNNDIHNLINSTNVATIFLDENLRIKRFTPQATKVINLIASDLGRPISDLVLLSLEYQTLVEDAQEVLRTLAHKEIELPTSDKRWYVMKIMPYRRADNVIDGLVMTFMDITSQKSAEMSSRAAQLYAESIVETVREALVVLDSDFRIVSTNPAFLRMFHVDNGDVLGNLLVNQVDSSEASAALQEYIDSILNREELPQQICLTLNFCSVGDKPLSLNARRIIRPSRMPPLILLAIEELMGQHST